MNWDIFGKLGRIEISKRFNINKTMHLSDLDEIFYHMV